MTFKRKIIAGAALVAASLLDVVAMNNIHGNNLQVSFSQLETAI